MSDITPKTALVTGADRGFSLCVVRRLAQMGWRVYAGRVLPEYDLLDRLHDEYPEVIPIPLDVTSKEDILRVKEEIKKTSGKLDLLFSNAAIMSSDGTSTVGGEIPMNFDAMEQFYRVNSIAAVLLVDTLLPLLEKSDFRHLFFTSSEISSVRLMQRTGDTRYALTKTALNLAVRMMFNELRPRGYVFRLYHPGWLKKMNPDGSLAERATIDPDYSAEIAIRQIFEERPDEDRLALVDLRGQELSF